LTKGFDLRRLLRDDRALLHVLHTALGDLGSLPRRQQSEL